LRLRPGHLSEPTWRGYIPLERAITGTLSLVPPVQAFERTNPAGARDYGSRQRQPGRKPDEPLPVEERLYMHRGAARAALEQVTREKLRAALARSRSAAPEFAP
jgi:hypothetical protein